MKKTLFLLFALIGIAACRDKELEEVLPLDKGTLYASMESIGATRTSMDQDNNVIWSEEDEIVAFLNTTLSARYQIKEQYVGTTFGGFSEVDPSGNNAGLDPGQKIDHNVVLYPYSDQVWCVKNDSSTPAKAYKLNVILPETQNYAENSFGNGAFPMVAVSSDIRFAFKNICGAVKLQFKGVDKIKSIKLEGLAEEAVSGKSSVIAYADGSAPTVTMAATASASVTLDCGDGVQLNESTPTPFVIAVPPVTFASGMKITVTDADGLSQILTNTSSNTVKRSTILNFPVITYKQDSVLELPEGALTSYDVPAEGGAVKIPIITNQDYQVVIPEGAGDWVTLAETKVLREEEITLYVSENTYAYERSAEISINVGEESVQVITICQGKAKNIQLPTNPDEFALIDLGLSVKWANYNMGAHSPYETGTATSWGHEEGKDVSYPTDMNISGSEYDLVRAELGGEWRLPTAYDFMELEQKCQWEPVVINDVAGNLVTGPNGNSIFLPDVIYWTGTARDRSTEDHDYLYGIYLTPKSSAIASGKFNRPVQGNVRLHPEFVYSFSEIGKNSATISIELVDPDSYDFDLGVQLKLSHDSSFDLKYSARENGKYIFRADQLSSGTYYNVQASYNVLGYRIEDYTNGRERVTTLAATDGDGREAEPVDVGLSVKWASWNLGASFEHDKGFKLAWGGISINDDPYPISDKEISGTVHDPATVLWGPEWRLPTMSEWAELIISNGSYIYRDSYINGIYGVTLKNKIFLPGDGVTSYLSGAYGRGCYFLIDAYCYTGSLLSSGNAYVRPVYDPLPQLDKASVYNRKDTSASLRSSIVRIGGDMVTEKGFVYSTFQAPTLETAASVLSETADDEKFEVNISGLSANTTYYARPYAINSYGISYGTEVSFTTTETPVDSDSSENIVFADDLMKELCVNAFDTNGDRELSFSEAAAVTDIRNMKLTDRSIEYFEEFQYFTGVTSVPSSYFNETEIKSITLPKSITQIADQAFYHCHNLAEVNLSEALISIGYRAFYYCTSLTDIIIPDSVTQIDYQAFYDCKGLKCVTLSNSLTALSGIFGGCSSLESITIPDSVNEISSYNFYNCTSLTSVTIPASVSRLGNYAFYGCSALKAIYLQSTVPPILATPYDGTYNIFAANAPDRKIYVPAGSAEAYKTADGWSTYADDIVEY